MDDKILELYGETYGKHNIHLANDLSKLLKQNYLVLAINTLHQSPILVWAQILHLLEKVGYRIERINKNT